MKYWCPDCQLKFDEDDVVVWRDGDAYDPDTNRTAHCPYCLEEISESPDQEGKKV